MMPYIPSALCLKIHDFYGLLSGLRKNVYLCNHEASNIRSQQLAQRILSRGGGEVAGGINETFRVLKSNELRQYGEYRTKRLVLEAWDRFGFDN